MSFFKFLLFPISLVFRAIVSLRNLFYDLGILSTTKVSVPILSVGNISVGGSGKTPYILKLVEILKSEGKRPAVIYRGYKRTSKEPVLKVNISTFPASHFGDEATMVAFKTNVPVYVGSKRVQVAEQILKKENVDVILLDDGFQHRAIHRDVDIVILDATDEASSYWLLPSGRAREPLSSLVRADLVALHKVNLQTKLQITIRTDIQSSIVCSGLVLLSDWKNHQMNYVNIKYKHITIVCGVAKPEQVAKTFSRAYPSISYDLKAFSDHHIFTKDDMPKEPIVITEKDAIKLKDIMADTAKIYVLVTELEWNLKYETLASKLFTSN
jgi:tetraacyldisaccharide 4'-kinase